MKHTKTIIVGIATVEKIIQPLTEKDIVRLFALAEMWEECGKVCEMVKTTGWQHEKAAYIECAKDLRDVILGNNSSIEKI